MLSVVWGYAFLPRRTQRWWIPALWQMAGTRDRYRPRVGQCHLDYSMTLRRVFYLLPGAVYGAR